MFDLALTADHVTGAAVVKQTHWGIKPYTALFGALIPGAAGLGKGSAESFVNGMHTAMIVGAVLAAIGAVASAKLIPVRRAGATVEQMPAAAGLAEAA